MKKFYIPLKKIPTITAQQKGEKVVGKKVVHYDKPELADARELYLTHLAQHKPEHPISKGVPVSVKIVFYHPWKGGRGGKEWRWRTVKPDVDNTVKLFLDCMTKTGFWADDNQVTSLSVVKVDTNTDKEGALPGIFVQYDILHEDE